MLSTPNNEARPSRARGAGGGATMLRTAILAVACLAVAGPALARPVARNTFDGDWSVVIMTQNGACDPSIRYGLQISDGQVLNGGNTPVDVQGRVNPNGTVRVMVQSGGQWASGTGRLDPARGGGVWQGQGSVGMCSGTWVAERRSAGAGAVSDQQGAPMAQPSYGPVAQAPGGPAYNQPIYNSVPGPLMQYPDEQMPEAQGPQSQDEAAAAADYCAGRFRSYDPASGTYMGYDGMRHPCP